MAVHERLKLLPYETLVGFTIAAISALMFGVFNGGIRNSDENAEKVVIAPDSFKESLSALGVADAIERDSAKFIRRRTT